MNERTCDNCNLAGKVEGLGDVLVLRLGEDHFGCMWLWLYVDGDVKGSIVYTDSWKSQPARLLKLFLLYS